MEGTLDCYKEFNGALKFFMRELVRLYPDIAELKLMLFLYKTMKTVSKKSPQKYFHGLIEEHSEDLLKRNMSFFMGKEFDDPVSTKVITRFKKEYELMSEENKEMVWKHMVVLYHLSVKCAKFDTEYVNIKQDGLQTQNPRCSREAQAERDGKQGAF